MTASRPGTVRAAAASRLLHGFASARPGMSGSSAAVPTVATTTACRAVSEIVVPDSSVTSTTRSEPFRPCARYRVIPAEPSQDTCPSSFQSEAKTSRRRSTAATARSPETASRTPGSCLAARRAAVCAAAPWSACTPARNTRRPPVGGTGGRDRHGAGLRRWGRPAPGRGCLVPRPCRSPVSGSRSPSPGRGGRRDPGRGRR